MIYFASVRHGDYSRSAMKGSKKARRLVLLVLSVAFLSSCIGVLPGSSGTNSLNAPPPPNFTQGLLLSRSGSPLYPLQARNLEVEGWAMVSFSVNANGNVIQNTIDIVNSEPEGYFERSSLVAARTLEFENFAESFF